jgi:hypothetical protein
MLKGALHAHSTFSDGEFTLAELRQTYLAEGCTFLCITDHAEYFDEQSIRVYLRDLASHSDQRFCFVPGLEYRGARDMHILGYGATALSSTTEPESILRHIAGQGAISVIAHPKDDFFSWIEGFETLPQGIETWNSKYDGHYGPRPGTFALLRRLQQRSPEMYAFYGQDQHWRKQFRGLCVMADCETVDPSAILAALRTGKYHGQKENLRLPSSGRISDEQLAEFGKANARSRRIFRAIGSGKRALDRLGIRIPDSVKAHLRRIY